VDKASKRRRFSIGSIRRSSSAARSRSAAADAQLINVAILSQVLNGSCCRLVIILMLMLINRKDLMGEYKTRTLET